MAINAPFTEADLQRINEGLTQLDQADQQIALAKQAGIDVAAQEAEAKKQRDQLERIKQVYFPGQ